MRSIPIYDNILDRRTRKSANTESIFIVCRVSIHTL